MALTKTSVKANTAAPPRWPESVDSGLAWVDYDIPADEFLVYFGGRPVPAISSSLDNAPGFEDTAIMIGLDADGEETGEIVGVQVIPMLLGAVQDQPSWAVLTWAAMAGDFGTELLRERLPGFLDAIHDAFDRYWSPAPPIEEQLAAIERVRHERESAAAQDRKNAAPGT
jgi:hypothetical protein